MGTDLMGTDEWEKAGRRRHLAGIEIFTSEIGPSEEELYEPLLVIHGFPTSSFDYRLVARGLAKNRKVLLLDLPGFGLSAKPDMRYSVEIHADVVMAYVSRARRDGAVPHDARHGRHGGRRASRPAHRGPMAGRRDEPGSHQREHLSRDGTSDRRSAAASCTAGRGCAQRSRPDSARCSSSGDDGGRARRQRGPTSRATPISSVAKGATPCSPGPSVTSRIAAEPRTGTRGPSRIIRLSWGSSGGLKTRSRFAR